MFTGLLAPTHAAVLYGRYDEVPTHNCADHVSNGELSCTMLAQHFSTQCRPVRFWTQQGEAFTMQAPHAAASRHGRDAAYWLVRVPPR